MVTETLVTLSKDLTRQSPLNEVGEGAYLVGFSGRLDFAMFVDLVPYNNNREFKMRLIESKYTVSGHEVKPSGRAKTHSKVLVLDINAIQGFFKKAQGTVTVADVLDLFEVILNEGVMLPRMRWMVRW